MTDFLMMALLVIAFAGTALYVRVCANVTERSGDSAGKDQ
jgi:hypothetical protein